MSEVTNAGSPMIVKINKVLYRSRSDTRRRPGGYALFECVPLSAPDEIIYVQIDHGQYELKSGAFVQFVDCVQDASNPILYHSTGIDFDESQRLNPNTYSEHLRYVLETAKIGGMSDVASINQVVSTWGMNAGTHLLDDAQVILLLNTDLLGAKRIERGWKELTSFNTAMLRLRELKIPPAICYGAWIYAKGTSRVSLINEEIQPDPFDDSDFNRQITERAGRLIEQMAENPFLICDEARCCSFQDIDKLERMEKDDIRRVRSLVLTILRCNPDTYVEPQVIMNHELAAGLDEQIIQRAIKGLKKDKVIVQKEVDHQVVYMLKQLNDAEQYIAAKLFAIRDAIREPLQITPEIEERITLMDRDDDQQEAVRKALQNNICLLTGGAGSGKTTTVRKIYNIFKRLGFRICLAAPTGRAAQRLATVTGGDAQTIHSLLKWNGDTGVCEVNEEHPLSAGVVIVDESSMISTKMMYNLLKAVDENSRLIFVGDWHQLRPVDQGVPFKDMCLSHAFTEAKLTGNHRSEGSKIVDFSRAILNHGQISMDEFYPDVQLIECADNQLAGTVLENILDHMDASQGDSIILCQTKEGIIGRRTLNPMIQERYVDRHKLIYTSREGMPFYMGDRVLATVNKFDGGNGVAYNGDIGTIIDYAPRETDEQGNPLFPITMPQAIQTVKVGFRQTRVVKEYDVKKIGVEEGELDLAYTLTVHKSQGSEFDTVIFMLGSSIIEGFMDRFMLYTAVTRAKKKVIIIGTKSALDEAINSKVAPRDWLRYRLNTWFSQYDKKKDRR